MQADQDENSLVIISDLQATILALRDCLEEAAFETKRAEQREKVNVADEIQQLKNTASSLRGELEKFT